MAAGFDVGKRPLETTPSEAAKKLAATIVKRANEGVQQGIGINAEFKPAGLETLIEMYFDAERKAERERCVDDIYRAIGLRHGYRSAQEFLDDCGFQRALRVPIASSPEMRARIRELASPPRDDFDRAILIVLDDFDKLEARTNVR